MNQQPVQVAIAILYRSEKFLLQLRDNIPHISFPGKWALFGGHLEPGETPEVGLKRELIEEISCEFVHVSRFGIYADEKIIRHVFHAPLLVELNQLVLNEGWDMGLLTPEDIHSGSFYSANAREIRPLADIHRQILLDFINKSNS